MKILSKLRAQLFRKKFERDMADEMQVHLEMKARSVAEDGASAEEARYAARRAFGGEEQIKERCRDERARGWVWIEQTGQDFRYAARQWWRNPLFASIAILSLALGIAANTAIFSVYREVLLRPLPVKNPDDLVLFKWIAPVAGFKHPHAIQGWADPEPGTKLQTSTSFSQLSFEWFRDNSRVFTDVFAFAQLYQLNVKFDGQTEISSRGQLVSGGYFAGLDLVPAAGRLIKQDDDRAGAPAVVVLSFRYWKDRFAADPAVLGKLIEINHVPFTVIGVSAAGFSGTLQVGESPDVFVPLARASDLRPEIAILMRQPWRFWYFQVMGRLRRGVPRAQAEASLQELFRQSALDDQAAGPVSAADRVKPVDSPSLRLLPGRQGLFQVRRAYAQPLGILLGLAGMVLLIACTNVANLLLARGAARRREIATRLALGAGRGRIIRQLILENSFLVAGATAVGLLLAYWGKDLLALHTLVGAANSSIPVVQPRLDWPLVGFTMAIAFLSTLLFGLIPAWRATRLDLRNEIHSGSRGIAGGGLALDRALMVFQVSLSLMLLVGAGLFLRTMRNLQQIEVGFNRRHLLLFRLDAGSAGYANQQSTALFERLAERIGAAPGVEAASYSSGPMLSDWSHFTDVTIEPNPGPRSAGIRAATNSVRGNFFATLQLAILAGRSLDSRDIAGASRTVVINETLARQLFAGREAVGRRIWVDRKACEVVGVTTDAKYANVREDTLPVLFLPFAQNAETQANFAVRVAGEIDPVLVAIREILRADRVDLPMIDARTQEQQIDRQIAQEILFAQLSAGFGVVVVVLVGIGLYGLTSYAVARRTREIGVRVALGAVGGQIVGMILRESLGLAGLGAVVGLAGALAGGRLVAGRLFGLSAADPLTYIMMTLLILSVVGFASLIPARRAAQVDPLVALRAE